MGVQALMSKRHVALRIIELVQRHCLIRKFFVGAALDVRAFRLSKASEFETQRRQSILLQGHRDCTGQYERLSRAKVGGRYEKVRNQKANSSEIDCAFPIGCAEANCRSQNWSLYSVVWPKVAISLKWT